MDRPLMERLAEVFKHTWDLGFTAFGGPPSHVQILNSRFVQKYKWLDEQTYQEVFALSQTLPGPGSTKLNYTISFLRGGFIPAVLAFFLWSLPGAFGMYGFSRGVSNIADTLPQAVYALLSGLNSATVGIVAVAAAELSSRTIGKQDDGLLRAIVAFTASAGVLFKALWWFPLLMVVSGLTTLIWDCGGGKNWARRARQRILDIRNSLLGTRRRENTQSDTLQRDESESAQRGGQVDIPLETLSVKSGAHPTPSPTLTFEQNLPLPKQPEAAALAAASTSNSSRGLSQRIAFRTSSTHPSTPPRTPSPHLPASVRPASLQLSEPQHQTHYAHTVPIKVGIILLVFFFACLITLLVLRGTLPNPPVELQLFANLFLAGTVIIGGGPVVIPLLREYIVTEGWVSDRDFLLGLAVIQAFPGPNFNFAVYLASLASKSTASPAIATGILGFIGIFFPGMCLTTSMISIFPLVRKNRFFISAIRGINAGASGLVWTAVYRLWEIGYLTDRSSTGLSLGLEPWWVVCALVSYGGNKWYRVPVPISILLGAVMGLVWWGVTSRTDRKSS